MAVKLPVFCAVSTVPLACVMAPSVLLTLSVPVLVKLPSCKPPAVSVMVALPPTDTLPKLPWSKPCDTEKLAKRDVLPPVCANEVAIKLPVPEKLPPLWVKVSKVVEPVLTKIPSLWVKLPKVMPPAPTFRVPAVCDRLPPAPVSPSMLTAPLCAGATTVLPKLTVTPDEITTLATLAKSGTAPPTQLAGSNQLPDVPPCQVTEFNRVMALVLLDPRVTV